MLTPNDLAAAFERNVRIVKRQAEGLTHADSLIQPASQGNCLNWVVGHMTANRDQILETLGEPLLAAPGARYTRGSQPLTGDGEGVLPLEELLARLEQTQPRIAAALERLGEAGLAREETQDTERKRTVGQQVFFLYFHEVYHVGQTEQLRQLAGKYDTVI